MKIQIGDQVREMTADERANYDTIIANAAKAADDKAAAIASARAKLAALGLTEQEIAALLGV
jgi:hypothetical protein